MDDEWSLFDVRDKTEFGPVRDMIVAPVSTRDVHAFCQRWHYTQAGRNLMYRYGLWDGTILVAAVAYNLPTRSVCESVFGPERYTSVAHMTRLVSPDHAPRNALSKLVSGSLKQLHSDQPHFRTVLTYAAQDQHHIGYIYQATNAIYTGIGGATEGFTDQEGKLRGDYLSGKVTASRAALMGWTKHTAKPKHRYLYLLGSKTERKESLRLLKYESLPYPKANGVG